MDYQKLYNLIPDNFDTLVETMYNNSDTINEEFKTFNKDYVDLYLASEVKDDKDNILKVKKLIIACLDHYKSLVLKEEDEIKFPRTKIRYVTVVGDTEIKVKLFYLYVMLYAFEANLRHQYKKNTMEKKTHAGIDYEFNNRQIAIMQINFETIAHKDVETKSYIWLVNPGPFDKKDYDNLIINLMTNKHIYKILHGPDSLDIPYMYEVMFKGNQQVCLDFTAKIFDTRFLCEYFRLSVSEEKKCSIYDALMYFGTISEEKYRDLEDTHDAMGPVQDISWNLKKMSSHHLKYALYDTLFLQHFLTDIFRMVQKRTPQYARAYHYLTALTRFVFLERREVTDIISTCKDVVNPINNYMIKERGKNITLVSLYNATIDGMYLEDIDVHLNFLMTVGYFKKTISFLFKYIVYHIATKNYTVHKNKFETYNDGVDLGLVFDKLKKHEFKTILELLGSFNLEAQKKISVLV